MLKNISLEKVRESIILIGDERVILDSTVAKLYGVETKRINEAVKNNPAKFPTGYIIKVTPEELEILRTKISTTKLTKTRTLPLAFTEKGLYMLATILKSNVATKTTLAIIETFAKMRELSGNIRDLVITEEPEIKEGLVKKSGEILGEIIENDLKVVGTETSFELNFALVKFKHLVKRGKKP
jgi:hypothetical protein